jgi:hypothetical protein
MEGEVECPPPDEDNRMDTGFDEEYHEEAQEKDTSNSSNSK